MIRPLLRAILPERWMNALRRAAIALERRRHAGLSSAQYWSRVHVDAPDTGFSSVEASLTHYAWRNAQYPGTLDMLPVAGQDGKTILDYGCGPGNDTIGFGHFSQPGRLIAADVSAASLDLARRRCALHGIAAEFLQLTEQPVHVPLPDGSVDLVHSAGVLHHTPDPVAILAEFRRILAPGGAAQVMVYNRDSVWMHLHVAWDMRLAKGLYADLSLEEAFARTTDGAGCPIANCYAPREFLDLAAQAGLEGEFLGAAVSSFEMTLLPLRWNAIRDQRLAEPHRAFLSALTFDARGFPLTEGRVAGINGCYRLRRRD